MNWWYAHLHLDETLHCIEHVFNDGEGFWVWRFDEAELPPYISEDDAKDFGIIR